MTQPEYEQKKRECWEEFCRANPSHNKSIFARKVFDFAFDRAYALGKQAEIISLEEDGRAAEREDEFLTVSRKDIQYYYQYHKAKSEARLSAEHKAYYKGRTEELLDLFGPKCLPDKTCIVASAKPKPAELKYHVGDWVRVVSADKHGHIGQITEVEYEYGCNYYQVSGTEGWHFLEKNLEPYTEPDKESPNLSQETANYDKEFDTIHKDSVSNERRLNVAAMAMQGILSNSLLMEMFLVTNQDKVVHFALAYADALISRCELSAQPLCHAKKGGQE